MSPGHRGKKAVISEPPARPRHVSMPALSFIREVAMARLVYSINVTLDGCADHSQAVVDDEHHDYALTLVRGATALLLGRNTFELFESHWPHVAESGSGPGRVVALARELGSKPKYVVSRQRTTSKWAGSVFLPGEVGREISTLK